MSTDKLNSKIEFSPTPPDAFNGDKLTLHHADEEGMGFSSTFWPAMTRCQDCGRFVKRGLKFTMKHMIDDCPLMNPKKLTIKSKL